MCWATRRPTAWIRSVVPIVWRTQGEVACQSPARGWAPPTTTTVRAPGSRSPGRWPAGAWLSKAAASATPHTSAPALRAAAFNRAASGRRAIPLLQLAVLSAHRAHPHALEALGDRVAKESKGLHALGEEVTVDHRAAARRVLLAHEGQQRLLEGADPVGLGARMAPLAIVGR